MDDVQQKSEVANLKLKILDIEDKITSNNLFIDHARELI